MKRIAIVGANGQVGTEVCLRLREVQGSEVVAIARNPSGSAFLRLNGVDCRHGRIADAQEAGHLIGDCNAVVNFALSTSGVPAVDRDVNREILRGVVAGAKHGVPIIFASTMMVYAPGTKLRLPDSYGMEKLIAERTLSRLCRRAHPLFVFRLGHVLGDLQNLTRKIKNEIREQKVALPREGMTASNTVFTSTIVEAILQAVNGAQSPGTYDLITSPQWSWREVYTHYASQAGAPLVLQTASRASERPHSKGLLRRSLAYLRRSQSLRERLMFFLAYLPVEVNQRVYTRYLQTRALSEIDALRESQKVELSVPDWREIRTHPMPGLDDALTLESRYPLRCPAIYATTRIMRSVH